MHVQLPFDQATLLALAPTHIINHRTNRFIGDSSNIALSDLEASDQTTIQNLYSTLRQLFGILKSRQQQPAQGIEDARTLLKSLNWSQLLRTMQTLGQPSYKLHPTPVMREVIHDVRGGSFMALSVNLQLIEMGLTQPEDFNRMFFLTRDHLKIMRNGVRDIDPELAEHDHATQAHHLHLLVEKWSQAVHQLGSLAAEVIVDCPVDRAISERCVEFSALDRVIYNLMNNAARNTADSKVYLSIFPVGEGLDESVRFVIANRIAPEHQQTLETRFPEGLGSLFEGGFTTGGSGLGMRICSQFVANAYGMPTVERCVRDKYIGAISHDGYFITWFHWPVVAD